MLKRLISVIILIFLITPPIYAIYAKSQDVQEESDQQISDFSLSGYTEKGKKSWDLAGKTADIFNEIIKLKEVKGNLYGKEEDILLTAAKGDFNKTDGRVHLEDNVVITTSTGSKLTTESLDWDRKNQTVTTEDFVNIEKENMVTTAIGVLGKPNLNNIVLKKDVKVRMNPETDPKQKDTDPENKMVITCDGPLEIDYGKNVATFNNNVKVDRPDSQIYSDIMYVYFLTNKDAAGATTTATAAAATLTVDKAKDTNGSNKSPALMGNKIDKIIAKGNVKIVRGDNVSYSDEAIYTASDKKIILNGRPKLVLYSTEDLGAAFGGEKKEE